MERMTYWNKDGIFVNNREYKVFAKRASRMKITTTEYMESLGFTTEFKPSNKSGRPKDSLRREVMDRNRDVSIVVHNGKLVSQR